MSRCLLLTLGYGWVWAGPYWNAPDNDAVEIRPGYARLVDKEPPLENRYAMPDMSRIALRLTGCRFASNRVLAIATTAQCL